MQHHSNYNEMMNGLSLIFTLKKYTIKEHAQAV